MENSMLNAFLHRAEEKIVVKAEDIVNESSGIDYKLTFFEPQPSKTYKVKLIANPFGLSLQQRTVYKDLPDPTRKGKTFHYVSSGGANECQVLQLFFDINKLEKDGDPLAIQKRKKFLGNSKQACVIVQILSSDDAEEIGMYRLMTFPSYGQNAHLATLIDGKLNPSEADQKEGIEKEDLFNIFESSILMIDCQPDEYEGKPSRNFSKSKFLPKKDSASIKFVNSKGEEVTHKFSPADILEDGTVTAETLEAINAITAELKKDEISMHNMFAYKPIGHELNTESTEKYLAAVKEKVEKIVPIIRDAKTISECLAHGVADNSKTDNIKGNIPTGGADELSGSALNGAQSNPNPAGATTATAENTTATAAPTQEMSPEVLAILAAQNK